ncbi:MAG: hypothetical protein GXO39_08910 [Thermotogae bacterium]|nr:hypothetical protein [Thermotogota bacterium]
MRTLKGFQFEPGMPPEKLVEEIKKLASPSAPVRTVWVNPTTGSDTNDGSEASPFATLDKALFEPNYLEAFDGFNYTSPELLVVVLAPGQYQLNGSKAILFRKNVILYGDFSGGSVIVPTQMAVQLVESAVSLYNCKVDGVNGSASLFSTGAGSGSCEVSFTGGQIDIGTRHIISHGGGNLTLELSGTTVKKTSTGLLLYGTGAPFDYYRTAGSIQDANGNALQDTDILGGIVRDANNLPRNVRSNIVL